MAEGRMLPYVDAVSHRGPLVYFPPAIVALVTGGGNALPVRICSLALMIATAVLLWIAHRRAGGVAAVAYVVLAGFVVRGWIPYHSEHVINVCALGAFAVATRASVDRERAGKVRVSVDGERAGKVRAENPRALAIAGALAIGSFLCKIVAIYVVLVVAIVIVARERGPRARGAGVHGRRAIAFFALGAFVPLLLLVLRYAIAGEVRTLVYFFWTYNARVYMAPFTASMMRAELWHFATEHALALVALAAAVVWLFRKKKLFETSIALMILFGLVSAKAPLREFVHYYLPLAPWLALTAALFVFELHDRLTSSRTLASASIAALGAACIAFSRKENLFTDPSSTRVCRIIEEHSNARDALFVWGFQPWLYVECKRKPASRYLFSTFVMGYVPWFDEPPDVERARVSPRSHEILLGELEARPKIIVDAPIGWRSLDRYDDLAPVLADYSIADRDGERTIYARLK